MKLPFTFERALILALIIAVLFLSLCSSPTVVVSEGPSKEDIQDMLDAQKEQMIQDYNLKIEDEALKRDSIGNGLMSNESNWDSLHRTEFGD